MKAKRNPNDIIRIHQIAKAYGKTPTQILFPGINLPPMVALALDNLIFDVGYENEMKIQSQLEIEKLKCLATIITGTKIS